MIPASCLLEVVFDRVHYSRDTKLSIMVVLVGVAVCTVTDVSVNAKGMLAAVIAVWSTAFQQYVSWNTYTVWWFAYIFKSIESCCWKTNYTHKHIHAKEIIMTVLHAYLLEDLKHESNKRPIFMPSWYFIMFTDITNIITPVLKYAMHSVV